MNKREAGLFGFIGLWGILSFGAFICQFFIPEPFSKGTSWGFAPGWQREIALWNLAIDTAIAYAVWKKNVEQAKLLTGTLAFLSLLLGLHHLQTAVTMQPVFVHWVGFLENIGIGTALGLFVLKRYGMG